MEKIATRYEYLFRCSPSMLYNFLTTADGLTAWFCDEVDVQGKDYIFSWQGNSERAILVEAKEKEHVKFEWRAKEEGKYLSFDIAKSPITRETILSILDFAEPEDVDEQNTYWNNLIDDLKSATGG